MTSALKFGSDLGIFSKQNMVVQGVSSQSQEKGSGKVETKTAGGRLLSFLSEQGKIGGLAGDAANVAKLSNFWTKVAIGHTTEASSKITEAGCLLKNYAGVWELPGNIAKIACSFDKLSEGTARSVGDFASAVFSTGKNFFDVVELAGTRLGLLSAKVVSFLSPLNPAGTLAFAANEAIFKNGPALRDNWKENDARGVAGSLLKLVKHVCLAAVGALALIGTFFLRIAALAWVIPSLLTVAITCSIASRFWEGLIVDSSIRNAVM